jgi:hypothetical protein
MSDKYLTLVQAIELLAVSAGRIEEEPKVILTFRSKEVSDFEVTNLAISPQQAQRLITDLTVKFQGSKLLASVRPLPDEAKQVFEKIMNCEPDDTSIEQREGK